jgi:sugar O-acyltransferase (sialic acid O-acetyltransferase NeuD family)
MNTVVILGTGGHAKELVNVMDKTNFEQICFFDDTNSELDKFFDKFKILRSKDEFRNNFDLVIGTGNPQVRKILYDKTKYFGKEYLNIISKTAIIGEQDVKFGWGLNIMHQVFISDSISIGNGTLINRLAGIHHDVQIGSFCEIGPGTSILGGVSIGDSVFIGANSVILPKIKINDNVIIGAGSVVTKEIPANVTVVGVPAKILTK